VARTPLGRPSELFAARSNIEPLLRATGMPDLPLARALLAEQLRAAGVSEDVVAAFMALPRHCFAPASRWRVAYLNLSLRAGPAWLIRPETTARVLDAMPRRPGLRVLEIRSGNGYQTALLALLQAEVLSVDISSACIDWARMRVLALGMGKVTFELGDAVAHGIGRGDFPCVIVNAALPFLPTAVLRAVSSDGGVLIAPMCSADGSQRLVRYSVRSGDVLHAIDMGACNYPVYRSGLG
jgi:protein-L-isoaspartate(D-aspartate) O-methyltransferase